MNRVFAFIDGFNFYHPIDIYSKQTQKTNNPVCLKWLNYWSLAKSLINKEDELKKVIFFTAMTDAFGEDAKNRHIKYIDALRAKGVEIVFGKFKQRDRYCKVKSCFNTEKIYMALEEKRTDVNIAVNLVKSALKDEYDKALLFSADTDLVPAIEMVIAEGKKVIPARLMNFDRKLNQFVWPRFNDEIPKAAQNAFRNIRWKTLKKHLLEKTVYLEGRKIVMPPEYMPLEDVII